MGTISEKLTYLNGTKGKLKDSINKFRDGITDQTKFRDYATELDGIYDKLPKVSGNGTDFSLENAQNGKLDSFGMDGNTEQTTYSGKNLLAYTSYGKEMQGITTTYDSKDGALILNGTASNTFSNITKESSLNISTGTYTFSISEAKNYNVRLRMTYTDNTNLNATISKGSTSTSVNVTKAVSTQRIFIYEDDTLSGTTFTNEKIYVQLESGSTATSFEPYVGGTPSPNPDYPQNINVVSGNQTINVSGKNLFDGVVEEGQYNNTTGAKQTGATNLRSANYISVNPNSTINFSVDGVSKEINILEYKGDYTFIKYTNVLVDETITLTNETKFITLYRSSSVGSEKWQIEYNSTATTYEPYQSATYPIGLKSKNLFDINEYSNAFLRGSGNNVELTKVNDTTLKSLNKATTTNNYCAIPIPDSSKLLGKTVTVSVKVSLNNISATKMQFYYLSETSATTPIGTATDITSNGTYTLTETFQSSFPTGSTKIGFVIYGSANTSQPIDSYATWENIQIEENNQSTSYEPYYNYELCKIDTYKDSIKKSTGKNLFDKNNANILNVTFSDDGKRLSTSQSGKTLWIPCKEKTTYTVSKISSSRFRILTTVEEPANQVVGIDYVYKTTETTATFTTSPNVKYLCVYYFLNGTDTLTEQQILDSIQIEENSTATDYEPFGTDWYIKKEIGKVVLNGSETYGKSGQSTSTNFIGVFNLIDNNINTSNLNAYSNYFTNYSTLTDLKTNKGFAFYTLTNGIYNYLGLSVDGALITTVEQFKAWLSTHNTIIYYVLATPTYEKITNSNLISQLESIETFTGVNNFSVSNDNNVLPTLYVSRLKELSELS